MLESLIYDDFIRMAWQVKFAKIQESLMFINQNAIIFVKKKILLIVPIWNNMHIHLY